VTSFGAFRLVSVFSVNQFRFQVIDLPSVDVDGDPLSSTVVSLPPKGRLYLSDGLTGTICTVITLCSGCASLYINCGHSYRYLHSIIDRNVLKVLH
jgi:hypothetical protein